MKFAGTLVGAMVVAGAVVAGAGGAIAQVTAQSLVSDLRAQGYTWIEVEAGPTQFKVEAVRGTEKVELVIDAATGAELAREVERADREDRARTGSRVETSRSDHVDASGLELDDDRYDDRDDDRDDRYDDRDDDRDDRDDDRDDDRHDRDDDDDDDRDDDREDD